MLRLFLAWRLLRMLFPLVLFGFAALALTAAFRAPPRTTGPGQSFLTHVAQGVERTVKPPVANARPVLIHPLTPPTP